MSVSDDDPRRADRERVLLKERVVVISKDVLVVNGLTVRILVLDVDWERVSDWV